MIQERLTALRNKMEEKGIDFYIVPTADFHQSEYVGEYFKSRQYITGFTGSAGTAIITRDEARLWTDGRYFLQAGQELAGTTVQLMKMDEPDVPTMLQYLAETMKSGQILGFDGRVVSMGDGKNYEKIVAEKQGKIMYECDLMDEIWTNRPELSKEPVFALTLNYCGESTQSKLMRIREEMKKHSATAHILTTLDDICWILNIRGNDVAFSPLVLSYAIISMEKMDLYMDETKLSDEIKENFAKNNILLHPYNNIYEDVKKTVVNDILLIDPARLNYALYSNIPQGVGKIEAANPEILFKSIKNKTEVDNIRKAELKDSVAHVKFMKWLKENFEKEMITEMSASDKLDEFRMEQGNYIRPSFEPISSFAEHGAIVHYSSTPETNVQLKAGHLFMTDTGAGFYEGSTDITRTYALGEIPQFMKEDFTMVAVSHLRLANVKFMKGADGANLDIIARQPFWQKGKNYNHGTGHGVGYLLNIHEGPINFRWKATPNTIAPFEEGMIITDEPGFYVEGSHGIRLENELLVRTGEKNAYGQFMYFEQLTYIPMDLDAIDAKSMSQEDKKLLNEYHKAVYEKVSPYLSDDEKEWLKKYTREI